MSGPNCEFETGKSEKEREKERKRERVSLLRMIRPERCLLRKPRLFLTILQRILFLCPSLAELSFIRGLNRTSLPFLLCAVY